MSSEKQAQRTHHSPMDKRNSLARNLGSPHIAPHGYLQSRLLEEREHEEKLLTSSDISIVFSISS